MRALLLVVLALVLVPVVMAACVEPFDGMIVEKSVTFCSGTFDVPGSVTITGKDIVVDCNGAILRGIVGQSDVGVRIVDASNVTVRDCNILTFDQGVLLKNVTHSLIEENAVLKNRIGMRLIDAYENVIQDNADKSHQMPVSAVNSKFNVVMLGNRPIDHEFCEVNACNAFRDMPVCVSGDFYCSEKCSFETDDDCPAPAAPVEEREIDHERQVERLIEEAEAGVENKIVVPESSEETRKVPLPVKVFLYVLAYALAFIVLRLKKR